MSTLDQRYLGFREATAAVFAAVPELEPLRFFVFKELLVKRREVGVAGVVRHWWRQAGGKRRSPAPSFAAADVLLWIESQRDVLVDPMLALHDPLSDRGIAPVIVSRGGPEALSGRAIPFTVAPSRGVPGWARRGWEGLASAVPELGRHRLRRAFEIEAASVAGVLAGAERLLDGVRPKVVVTASNNSVGGAALVIAARRRGIPTVLLQHGMPQAFYTPVLNHLMLTWGQRSNAILERLGVPAAKLRVTGSPRHDGFLAANTDAARRRLLTSLELADRLTLVYFSNGNDVYRNGEGPAAAARWLEYAAECVPGVNVVARLHPNEDGSLFAHCRRVVVTKQRVDVATALAGADIVASQCSTALDEALLFSKPVWQLEGDGWPELVSNWRDGLAARVGSAAELVSQLQAAERGTPAGRCDARLVESVFANRGHAAEVAAAAIVEASRGRDGRDGTPGEAAL